MIGEKSKDIEFAKLIACGPTQSSESEEIHGCLWKGLSLNDHKDAVSTYPNHVDPLAGKADDSEPGPSVARQSAVGAHVLRPYTTQHFL